MIGLIPAVILDFLRDWPVTGRYFLILSVFGLIPAVILDFRCERGLTPANAAYNIGAYKETAVIRFR